MTNKIVNISINSFQFMDLPRPHDSNSMETSNFNENNHLSEREGLKS